ncbi:putative DMT superfamily transporter inner membrane protein [compost metagenome]
MSKEFRSWFFLIILALIWGSSFILMKKGMYDESGGTIFSDSQVGALRMGIAGLVMLPFGLMNLKKISNWKQVFYLLVVGTCGNFFPAFLFTFAETKLSSGLAGMLNSFTPFFTLILGFLIFKQQIRLKQVIGLLVAFTGICILVGILNDAPMEISMLHVGAILLATLMYGISLNTIKYKLSEFKSLEIASLSFTFLAIPAWIVTLSLDTGSVLKTNSHAYEALFFISILSVFGTCLALLLFNQIIALKSPMFASSVTYMIPIVAVLLGVFLNREQFHVSQFLGMIVIVGGVYLVNSKQVKREK